jgi:hypothetical protein
MNKKWHRLLLVVLLVFSGCGKDESNLKVEREIVDGVLHLINPEEPLKGKTILEIEKIREIDPYKIDEFGLRWIDFKRDSDGELMFFNPNGSEIYRFGSDNGYLGKLTCEGQGPGEFTDFHFLNPFYMNQQLYVTGGFKLARFERNGDLIDERKIGQYPQVFVDESRFFIEKTERHDAGRTKRILMIDMDTNKEEDFQETEFFRGENVGWIEKTGGGAGYSNQWGIPNILYVFNSSSQRVFLCLNSEYKVYVKNLSGKTEYIIERPYKNVPVTEGDKRDILISAWKEEPPKWIVDTFPDHLVAIKSMKSLPNGYLAAYRVTGVESYEIDIFDPDGHYVYSVAPLESIDLDDVKFYGFGFARIKTKDDGFMIYEEYRIKNLPEIFKD